ncbi:hypothetical protein [Roseicella frigidaeris]|uniref:Uncharacterized protein n=1 Tax=Roseicella frigidaeris TaxID=2230885 RepID=A0A327M0H9_9PROT|nr:hypothetical protein [Roseicella frigidaeris]RAI55927.1 hypothetical protein DOO78_23555 [Roseicella frigidaeris]
MTRSSPIKINRAPVLTLWAAVVAERLGHPPDTALSLASAVAGTAARAKARRLGISEEKDHAKDAHATAPAKPQDTTELLGRRIRLIHDGDGVVLAEGKGKPAPATGFGPGPSPDAGPDALSDDCRSADKRLGNARLRAGAVT